MFALPLVSPQDVPLDDSLVAKAAAGDLQAFEAIYRQHAGRIQALCRRLTGDPHEAEEMVQEVFIRAWQKLATFQGRSSLSTWLHQIAIHAVFDAGRRAKRTPTSPIDDAGAATWAAPKSNSGLRVDLERAIDDLPAGAREVLVLHDVYGYGHEEIAALNGISAGTSKSQLHRARMLLRERLSP